MDIPEHDLPLFPLNTVLFPRMPLPLHIFEPRYQEMITRCLRERIGFGVLLIKEGEEVGGSMAETFTVGTIARILSADELEDGHMNIMTMGVVRFRLLHSSNEHPYLSGDIEAWEDEMGELKDLPKLTKAAHKAYINYMTELAQLLDAEDRPEKIVAPMDPQVLSYTIAANLQVADEEKQGLLEVETVQERLVRELEQLESERIYLQRVKLLRSNLTRGESSSFSKN